MEPAFASLLKKLTALRQAAGFSKEDVEKKLVLGPGWVERFETGDKLPSLATLVALLNLYEVKISDFFESVELTDDIFISDRHLTARDRKSTRLNSSHVASSYAVFCLKKKTQISSFSNTNSHTI